MFRDELNYSSVHTRIVVVFQMNGIFYTFLSYISYCMPPMKFTPEKDDFATIKKKRTVSSQILFLRLMLSFCTVISG